jgi:hypothetical protein
MEKMPDNPSWTYNPKSKRYTSTTTGRFISVTEAQRLRNEFVQYQAEKVTDLASDLVNDLITPQQWKESMISTIKDTYIDLYALGSGGKNNLTQSDYGTIGAMVKKQYGQSSYLENFYNQIIDGNLTEGQIGVRSRMYVRSAEYAFAVSKDKNVDLPAYPADGSTQCRVNCRCEWKIEEVYSGDTLIGYDCYWIVDYGAEHCPDCIDRGQRWNPYRVRL